jgi:hypothetical protein
MADQRAALMLLAGLVGCAPVAAAPTVRPAPQPAEPLDLDREACAQLCSKERACPAVDDQGCLARCDADRRRMKPGFVATYARCFAPRHSCQPAEREKAHLGCVDETLATFPRDERNQRDMAEAVCDRSERCMALGKLGRDACLQATLNPQESEIRLGQRIVDAFRPARVVAFRRCVDGAPCAKLGAADDVVDRCYAETIVEGP